MEVNSVTKHPTKEKVLVATGVSVPFIGVLAVGFAAQSYPLVFKVDIFVLSIVGLLMTVWNVVNNFIIGYLQDNSYLSSCFNKDSWGRRAPWVLINSPICLLIIFFVWYPPSVDPVFLLYWASGMLFLAQWTFSSVFIAALAVVPEMYPFKEERVEVEMYQLFWGGVYLIPFLFGAAHVLKQGDSFEGCGNVTDLICEQSAEQDEAIRAVSEAAKEESLVPAAAISGLFVILLLSVWPMRRATATSEAKGLGLGELKELEKNDAFSTYMVYSAIDAFAYGIEPAFMLFYFTYVTGLDGPDRAKYFILVPVLGAVAQAFAGIFWVFLFSKKEKNPTWYLKVGLMLDIIQKPILLQISTSIEMFMVSYTIGMLFKSPRVFWDTSVRGWLVDEDIQRHPGKRREALIVAFRSSIRTLANIGVSLLFIGMSVAGIDTTLPTCCPQASFGIQYIRLMFQVAQPLLQLYQVGIVNNFPLKGERLEKVIARQKDETPGDYGFNTLISNIEAAEMDAEGGLTR